jgi:protein SCO1/2
MAFVVLAAAAGLAGRAALDARERPAGEAPPGTEPLPVIATLPPFRFVERSGKPVGLEDLRGRIWVADFVFTNCAGVCPRMSMAMARVHEALRRNGDACVSFTVDPEHDTLEVLKGYAARYSASPDAWLFLRGPQAEVQALSYKGFLIGDEKDPFIHSERFALVDRLGRVRAYCRALDDGKVEELLRDYKRLRAEL